MAVMLGLGLGINARIFGLGLALAPKALALHESCAAVFSTSVF